MPRIQIVGMMVIATVSSACVKKKPTPAPAPVPVVVAPRVNQDSIDAANRARAAREAAERAKADSSTRADSIARVNAANAANAEAARLAAARAEARRTLDATIYFDYDVDEIRDDQKATLEAKVPILQANADVRIRITGHTDDRGSDEYNLALGQRRAAAVRRYLAAHGIAENRFDVESFGEQRPVNPGETEDTWAKNRRAEFEIIAGGNPLRVP